jgi:mRNA-degrading endonuclease RelE of RelBE toxin-antitoxin system
MTGFSAVWRLDVSNRAERSLSRLQAPDQERVRAVFAEMRFDPRAGDVVQLRAQPANFRRRAGPFRILFDLYPAHPAGPLLEIVDVLRRGTTTYRRRR